MTKYSVDKSNIETCFNTGGIAGEHREEKKFSNPRGCFSYCTRYSVKFDRENYDFVCPRLGEILKSVNLSSGKKNFDRNYCCNPREESGPWPEEK